MVKAYFQDLQFCITTQYSTTAWQHLEIGIMAGCTTSKLAFTMAMELIIVCVGWVGGWRWTSEERAAASSNQGVYDDMTTITTNNALHQTPAVQTPGKHQMGTNGDWTQQIPQYLHSQGPDHKWEVPHQWWADTYQLSWRSPSKALVGGTTQISKRSQRGCSRLSYREEVEARCNSGTGKQDTGTKWAKSNKAEGA